MDLTAKIDEKFAEWQSLQPLASEDADRLWRKLRLEWNYHSNHIEGNTLTYGETELLLIHDQTTGDHALRNYVEMKAHDLAIAHLRGLVDDERPLGESDIRDLNRILLKESFLKPAITASGEATRIEILPGQYKGQPNNVRTADGSIFKFAAPSEVPAKMATLVDCLRTIDYRACNPIEIASRLHHDFVLIHPFGDGNGRTARLLVNYLLMRSGFPPIVVPTEEKDRYLAALRKADAGDISQLVMYLGTCTLRALERGIRAAKGESVAEPNDLIKEMERFKQEQRRGSSKTLTKKSKASIGALYEHSLRSVFEEFAQEHSRLGELFHEIHISPTGIPTSDDRSWIEEIERTINSDEADEVDSLGIVIALRGFKRKIFCSI